jgi:hypothetical protein
VQGGHHVSWRVLLLHSLWLWEALLCHRLTFLVPETTLSCIMLSGSFLVPC